MEVEWEAEITDEAVNEVISWRSLDGAKVQNSGLRPVHPRPRRAGY
jgi:uncharacterized membrane protein